MALALSVENTRARLQALRDIFICITGRLLLDGKFYVRRKEKSRLECSEKINRLSVSKAADRLRQLKNDHIRMIWKELLITAVVSEFEDLWHGLSESDKSLVTGLREDVMALPNKISRLARSIALRRAAQALRQGSGDFGIINSVMSLCQPPSPPPTFNLTPASPEMSGILTDTQYELFSKLRAEVSAVECESSDITSQYATMSTQDLRSTAYVFTVAIDGIREDIRTTLNIVMNAMARLSLTDVEEQAMRDASFSVIRRYGLLCSLCLHLNITIDAYYAKDLSA